mmetsp:Transcript_6647/g.16931  ORF Transcript_6647/g.16931 Transcript_6647/m.16931 type:complete len:214 (-) Transcript_6647:87-728(-)
MAKSLKLRRRKTKPKQGERKLQRGRTRRRSWQWKRMLTWPNSRKKERSILRRKLRELSWIIRGHENRRQTRPCSRRKTWRRREQSPRINTTRLCCALTSTGRRESSRPGMSNRPLPGWSMLELPSRNLRMLTLRGGCVLLTRHLLRPSYLDLRKRNRGSSSSSTRTCSGKCGKRVRRIQSSLPRNKRLIDLSIDQRSQQTNQCVFISSDLRFD